MKERESITLKEQERAAIVRALKIRQGDSKQDVAAYLGIARSTLYRKMDEHQLTEKERMGK